MGGPIEDLAVDRHFAYSVGQDLSVKVWTVSDLKPVLSIAAGSLQASEVADINNGPVQPLTTNFQPKENGKTEDVLLCMLSRLTAVRRPASRWSGAQGPTRTAGIPRGMLFVAGAVASGQSIASEDSAVLM